MEETQGDSQRNLQPSDAPAHLSPKPEEVAKKITTAQQQVIEPGQ